jgi:hypothetical protein
VFIRCAGACCNKGVRSVANNYDILSVGPLFPDTMGLIARTLFIVVVQLQLVMVVTKRQVKYCFHKNKCAVEDINTVYL